MKRSMLIAALVLSLGIAGPAPAQQQGQQDQQTRTQGTIDSFRIVAFEGPQDEHLIVRITPQRGQKDTFTYVDLGSARKLKQQNVRVGRDMNLVAIGYLGRIHGVPVLMAERFELEGDRYALQRADRQRQTARADRQRQFAQQDRQRQFAQQDRQRFQRQQRFRDPAVHLIAGEVESIKDFSIQGIQDDHRLIKVIDPTGTDRTWIVDLGEKGQLQELDLQKGDRVFVQGRAARIEGKPVLKATQVAEVVTVDRNLAQIQEEQQNRRAQQQGQRQAR